jgi:Sigma-70, region 4
MSRLDDLPPDLRATLSLLLERGKSYAEIADMLAIPESTVRDRAHAALDALSAGPATARSSGGRPGSSSRTSPGERSARTARSSSPPSPAPSSASPPPPSTARARAAAAPPSSRRAGALLLVGLLAAVIVAVVLLSGGGGGSGKTSSTGSSAPTSPGSTSSKTSTSGSKPTEDKRITLSSPEPSSKSIGAVEVLSEGSKYAYYIAATNLPPSKGFFYAVWLYNSSTSHEAVSKAPNVGSDGRLQGGALLPADASKYKEMLLTRETNSNPTTPGPVVLKGAFALH